MVNLIYGNDGFSKKLINLFDDLGVKYEPYHICLVMVKDLKEIIEISGCSVFNLVGRKILNSKKRDIQNMKYSDFFEYVLKEKILKLPLCYDKGKLVSGKRIAPYFTFLDENAREKIQNDNEILRKLCDKYGL
jgi:arsenate reductase-like glutaredoxin family protein